MAARGPLEVGVFDRHRHGPTEQPFACPSPTLRHVLALWSNDEDADVGTGAAQPIAVGDVIAEPFSAPPCGSPIGKRTV